MVFLIDSETYYRIRDSHFLVSFGAEFQFES